MKKPLTLFRTLSLLSGCCFSALRSSFFLSLDAPLAVDGRESDLLLSGSLIATSREDYNNYKAFVEKK